MNPENTMPMFWKHKKSKKSELMDLHMFYKKKQRNLETQVDVMYNNWARLHDVLSMIGKGMDDKAILNKLQRIILETQITVTNIGWTNPSEEG